MKHFSVEMNMTKMCMAMPMRTMCAADFSPAFRICTEA